MKKLPNDVINGPVFWRWFYAGDGCLTFNKKKELYIRLFPFDFYREDVEKMQTMLTELNIQSSIQKARVNAKGRIYYQIYIAPQHVKAFIAMIGPPIKSIEYKWDLNRT